MRADPAGATTRQYFDGATQDALDRQLTATDFRYGIPLGKDHGPRTSNGRVARWPRCRAIDPRISLRCNASQQHRSNGSSPMRSAWRRC